MSGEAIFDAEIFDHAGNNITPSKSTCAYKGMAKWYFKRYGVVVIWKRMPVIGVGLSL